MSLLCGLGATGGGEVVREFLVAEFLVISGILFFADEDDKLFRRKFIVYAAIELKLDSLSKYYTTAVWGQQQRRSRRRRRYDSTTTSEENIPQKKRPNRPTTHYLGRFLPTYRAATTTTCSSIITVTTRYHRPVHQFYTVPTCS